MSIKLANIPFLVNIENFKNVKDNMKDNVRGTFNTLARAAQKLQKQISTDDVPTSDHHKMGSLKTQSQIELRENVRLKSLQQAYGIIPMFI